MGTSFAFWVFARLESLGFRFKGLGFRVQGLGFRVQGLGLRVWGLGFRVTWFLLKNILRFYAYLCPIWIKHDHS